MYIHIYYEGTLKITFYGMAEHLCYYACTRQPIYGYLCICVIEGNETVHILLCPSVDHTTPTTSPLGKTCPVREGRVICMAVETVVALHISLFWHWVTTSWLLTFNRWQRCCGTELRCEDGGQWSWVATELKLSANCLLFFFFPQEIFI